MLCVGAGGLGLARRRCTWPPPASARIGIVDFDVVDLSNLQRQIAPRHVRRRPAEARLGARTPLKAINPHVQVEPARGRAVVARTRSTSFAAYDVIVDGTDNFPTRYLVNDACVLLGKPNVYGSIFRFEGQASVFATKGGRATAASIPSRRRRASCRAAPRAACSACCPASSASIQATEAIKLILGAGEPLVGRLLLFDALRMRFRELKLRAIPSAPCAATTRPSPSSSTTSSSAALRPAPGAPASAPGVPEITVEELKQRLDRGDDLVVLDVREPHEFDIVRIEGSTVIPLGELSRRVAELDRARDLVVQCKVGGRSAKAVGILREQGFDRAVNLAGGILAWVDRIEPHKSKY